MGVVLTVIFVLFLALVLAFIMIIMVVPRGIRNLSNAQIRVPKGYKHKSRKYR